MALQGIERDFQLSLDDFIPRHLQKNQNSSPSQNHNDDKASPPDRDLLYEAKLVLTSDDTWDSPSQSPRVERRWIRYDGIGPTDEDGMPYASRSSVDKPREWYKNMFRVLHQMSDSEDSDSEGGSKIADHQTQSLNMSDKSRFLKDVEYDQSELENQSRARSQEPKNLKITLKSTIRESPSKTSTISKTQTSTGSSSNKPRSSTLPRHSSTQLAEMPISPRFSSEGPQFTMSSKSTHPSPNSTTAQSLRAQTNHSQTDRQRTEPAPRHLLPDRSVHSSQAPHISHVASRLISKGTSSRQSISDKDKYSSLKTMTSGTSSLGPTSRESRRSTSKVLEQLESDLRRFTEELDKDLEERKQRSENTIQQCEELLLRRSSYRSADGSPKTSRKHSGNDTEEQQALSPIAKAVVKFDFVAESDKEITLRRGTTVNILKKVDKNWLLGEQDGRRGLFPESYAKVLSPGQSEPADIPQLSAIALYDFKADSDAELPLRKGQRVLITRRVGGSWFEGQVEGSGRLGLFPASYVQAKEGFLQARKGIPKIRGASVANPVEQSSAGVTLKERPCTVKAPVSSRLKQLTGTQYRAVFNYSPKNQDELQLIVGDIVTVTQHCDDGWYVGVCWRTQKFGTFPGNFVAPYVTSEASYPPS